MQEAAAFALRFFAQHTVLCRRGGQLRCAIRTGGNQDCLRHALIERHDVMEVRTPVKVTAVQSQRRVIAADPVPLRPPVVEDADHSRISPRQDAGDASGPARFAVGPGPARRCLVDQHFVALHGAVQVVRRDEQVVLAPGAAVRTHKAEAVAVEVQPARDKVFAGRGTHPTR